MDLVGWAAWAWIAGIVGLVVAVLLLVSLRRRAAGAPAATEAADRIRAGAMLFLRREQLVLVAFVILAAALIGLATSLLTAAAYLSGAGCAALAGLLGALAGSRASVAAAAEAADGRPVRPAFAGGSVGGIALVSLALVGLGAWYVGLGAGAITDTDFDGFARVVSGFAFGAASVALFARISGGIQTAAARLAGSLTAAPATGLTEDDPRSPATVLARSGDLVGDVVGASAGLFESLAGSAVGVIVVGAAAQIYATSRGPAVALPVLTVLVSLLASLGGLGLARVFERQRLGAALRNVTLASTAVFLVLEYVVVRALRFEIVDPTGVRVYRPDAPFLAILAGALAGLAIAALSERAVSPARLARPAEEAPAGALVRGFGAALEASALPAFLVALIVWLSYYLAGIYGIGAAAMGMVGTAGIAAAVNSCGAIASTAGALAAAEAGADTRGEELAVSGRAVVAMGRGSATAGAALTALSLFIAYVSASGAEMAGLQLLDSALLAGLLLGVLVVFLVAGMAVHGAATVAGRIAAEAGRQLHEVKGLLQGRTGPDVARAAAASVPVALTRTVGPALVVVLVPVLAGMLNLELLAGLLVGGTLAGLLLALSFGHAGAVAEGAGLAPRSPEAEGAASPARPAGGPWRALAGPFADAAAPALATAMKLMAALALVLAPWLARLHGASILREETVREGARQLLALLGQ